jgi:hypothetical protein
VNALARVASAPALLRPSSVRWAKRSRRQPRTARARWHRPSLLPLVRLAERVVAPHPLWRMSARGAGRGNIVSGWTTASAFRARGRVRPDAGVRPPGFMAPTRRIRGLVSFWAE